MGGATGGSDRYHISRHISTVILSAFIQSAFPA